MNQTMISSISSDTLMSLFMLVGMLLGIVIGIFLAIALKEYTIPYHKKRLKHG